MRKTHDFCRQVRGLYDVHQKGIEYSEYTKNTDERISINNRKNAKCLDIQADSICKENEKSFHRNRTSAPKMPKIAIFIYFSIILHCLRLQSENLNFLPHFYIFIHFHAISLSRT